MLQTGDETADDRDFRHTQAMLLHPVSKDLLIRRSLSPALDMPRLTIDGKLSVSYITDH